MTNTTWKARIRWIAWSLLLLPATNLLFFTVTTMVLPPEGHYTWGEALAELTFTALFLAMLMAPGVGLAGTSAAAGDPAGVGLAAEPGPGVADAVRVLDAGPTVGAAVAVARAAAFICARATVAACGHPGRSVTGAPSCTGAITRKGVAAMTFRMVVVVGSVLLAASCGNGTPHQPVPAATKAPATTAPAAPTTTEGST